MDNDKNLEQTSNNINELLEIIDKKNKEIDNYKNQLDLITKENIFLKKEVQLLKSVYITKYD